VILVNLEEFRPEDVIGKSYEHEMLPYGGGVSLKTGLIAFPTSREEHDQIMSELLALE